MSLAGLGVCEQALRLAASATAECERIGVDLHLRFWDVLLERYLGPARQALGTEAADRAWSEGRFMPFAEAVAEALSGSRARSEPSGLGASPPTSQ